MIATAYPVTIPLPQLLGWLLAGLLGAVVVLPLLIGLIAGAVYSTVRRFRR